MRTNGTTALLLASVLAVASLLVACPRSGGASGGSASTSALRTLLKTGRASTATRSDRVASLSRAEATGSIQPQAVVSNPAGTILGDALAFDPTASPIATVVTDTGFLYHYDSDSGDVQELPVVYFTTPDCSGQAYLTAGSTGNSVPSIATRPGAGFGFTLPDGTAWMLDGNAAQLVDVTAQSQLFRGSCGGIGLSGLLFYAAVANDPSVSHMAGPNVGGAGTLVAP